jgi:hypothetical protein
MAGPLESRTSGWVAPLGQSVQGPRRASVGTWTCVWPKGPSPLRGPMLGWPSTLPPPRGPSS